jgi:hypothetical protein
MFTPSTRERPIDDLTGFEPAEPLPAPTPKAGARGPAAVVVLSVAGCALLGELLARIPCEYGEPLALRWLRAAGEHPLRSGLATALLWGAGRCFALGIWHGRA